MAIVIAGEPVEVPGLESICYLDDSRLRLRLSEDMARRIVPAVRGIVLHTTKGIPGGNDQRAQVIRPGLGAPVEAGLRCARYWSTARYAPARPQSAGAHLVVDFDGSVACCADLLLEAAFHAGVVNQVTVGIEIYQGSDAELYQGQLDAVITLVDFLTRRFGIQRQIPDKYRGKALERFGFGGSSGKNFYGIYGHRDVSNNRGAGDPGSAVFVKLFKAGYEDWNLAAYDDMRAWEVRQRALGLKDDGIPGPATVAALAAAGYPHGLWVHRPGDDPLPRKRRPSIV